MDTGCKCDVTTRGAKPAANEALLTEAERSLALSAASGYWLCDKVAAQHIGVLVEEVSPYALDSILDVLSIGALCLDKRYEFHRAPYSSYDDMP